MDACKSLRSWLIALNCWAKMDDMVGIANGLPRLSEAGAARLDRALRSANGGGSAIAQADLLAKRDELLALA